MTTVKDNSKNDDRRVPGWRFTWYCIPKEMDEETLDVEGIQKLLNGLSNVVDGVKCIYLCAQVERCPTTDRLHFQGYVHLKDSARRAAIKKLLDPVNGTKSTVSVHPCDMSAAVNLGYCTKDKTSVKEIEPIIVGKLPGKPKADKVDWGAVVRQIETNDSLADFARAYPEIAIKHIHGVKALLKVFKEEQEREKIKAYYAAMVLRPWQSEMWNIIKNCPRGKIIWVYDAAGLAGKSELIKWISINHGALFLTSAKTADIANSWNYQSMVVVDNSRAAENYFNMDAMERLASGLVYSPKYEGASKMAISVTVAIFANCEPNWETLSVGRWNSHKLVKGVITPLVDPRTR